MAYDALGEKDKARAERQALAKTKQRADQQGMASGSVMPHPSPNQTFEVKYARRVILKATSPARFLRGASAAALGSTGFALAGGEGFASAASGEGAPGRASQPDPSTGLAPASPYPKLAIITPYSRQKLAFATATGYEGVVVDLDEFFDPDKLSDSQIDEILATSRETGARIISIECMWGFNHIDPDPAAKEKGIARFIRCLEFAHRLGCKFCGTFSGGIPGADFDRQAKELAEVVNEKYVPVLDKLDISMGWENYPTAGQLRHGSRGLGKGLRAGAQSAARSGVRPFAPGAPVYRSL